MGETILMPHLEDVDGIRMKAGCSRIFLDKEGRWFHEGVEITHQRTCRLFARSLFMGSDGLYRLQLGKEHAVVELEDAPYIVRSVTTKMGDQGIPESYLLLLNDETEEQLDPRTLFIRSDHVMYCRVKEGAHHARFLRSSYYQLCQHIKDESNPPLFWLPWKGERIAIRTED